jgi:glycosyltransferase involved in cell wall biosynthesis
LRWLKHFQDHLTIFSGGAERTKPSVNVSFEPGQTESRMISFVVPAHNEQGCLARTLEAIHSSAEKISQAYEIIVVDDASTDATSELAQSHGAKVVRVNHRQIAATRNSGARAASGERIFFVDADTAINARAVAAALRQMDKGAVGGGAPFWVEGPVPLYVRLIEWFGGVGLVLVGFSGGAFMFCTREAFQASGGFSERVYWGEEGTLALALKRQGKFVVLWERVLTSGRRFRKTSALELATGSLRMLWSPMKMMTERKSVEKIWYDSNRHDDDSMPNSILARVSNAIALPFLLVLITGPLWNFIPRSMTPLSSGIGKFRFCIAFILCHMGLLLGPVGILLFVNLLRQKRWAGSLQTIVVIAFCSWQGWACVRGVIRVWTQLWNGMI